MFTVGTNILSLRVQRTLSDSSRVQSETSEKLASGQRINRAQDDAAGLAISMALRVDARVFSQGIRNLNDGISAVNIAESALGALTGIGERIKELAAQSMTGTYTDRQRASTQIEVAQLQEEWNRIVESTNFQGSKILQGENSRVVLQGGKGASATLQVNYGADQKSGARSDYVERLDQVAQATMGAGQQMVSQISAQGRYVSFSTNATNIISGDTNGVHDVFVLDTNTRTVQRLSTSSAGVQGNGNSQSMGVSINGEVLFTTEATNLDSQGVAGLFVRKIGETRLERVDLTSSGQLSNGSTSQAAIAAGGRFVAFSSSATNLAPNDTNGVNDVFLKDRVTGSVARVSETKNGVQGNGASTVKWISPDGKFVAFESTASNFATSDTNGLSDAFLKDMQTGELFAISSNSSGATANGSSWVTSASVDGRYVSFTSDATNLVSGDTNGVTDVFVKDLVAGSITRVSVDSNGQQGNSGSYDGELSADGRYLAFFSFASNLDGGDAAPRDAFHKDLKTGAVTRLSIGDNGGQIGSLMVGLGVGSTSISADGRKVLFATDNWNFVTGSGADGFAIFDIGFQTGLYTRDMSRIGVQQLAGMMVTDRVSAAITFDLVQRSMDEVSLYRSNLGASTSRLTTFMSTLSQSELNYREAESRITDADVAEQAATVVVAQIRQQVAASLLGQANQTPQIGLSLLQAAGRNG